MPQRPPLDIGSVLLAWACLQGGLVSVLLALRPGPNRAAGRWLALLVATVALTVLDQLLARHGHLYLGPDGRLLFLTIPASLLIGPLFHRYAHALLDRPFPARRWWMHGAPALVALANALPGWIQVPAAGWPETPVVLPRMVSLVPFDGYLHAIAFTGLIAAYVMAADRLLRDYGPSTRRAGSRSTLVDADRIRILGIAIGGAATVFAVAMGWMWGVGTHVPDAELAMALALSLVVHLPGALTLLRPEVYAAPMPAMRAVTTPSTDPARSNGSDLASPPEGPRYGRTGLDAAAVSRLAGEVRAFVEREACYLDPDLRLADLARGVGVTPNQLSQVLNQGLGTTFFDFVNGYRIEEVKRRLRDPASASLTHLAIALEAGFSSKSSFHRIFKKRTGQTPSAYARDGARVPSAAEA